MSEAYKQGQKDREQGWPNLAELWDFRGDDAAAYGRGWAEPRVDIPDNAKAYRLPDGTIIRIHDETLHRHASSITYTLKGGTVVIAVEVR